MAFAHEHYSAQFAAWERRGRGWQVYDQPVAPEPPFVPCQYRSMTERPPVDDGRRPTFLSSFRRNFLESKKPAPPPLPEPETEPEPRQLKREPLVELQVTLPAKLDLARESFEQLFRNLTFCNEPIAFELVGTHQRVLAQFAASDQDVSLVRRQLTAHFPEAQFRQQTGTLEKAWGASPGGEAFALEFGLEREFMLPLATGKLDPFIGIVGALAELSPGDLAVFQVLWQPVQQPWAESIIKSVTQLDGKPLFVNATELAGAAEQKVSRPLFATVVRMLARTETLARLHEIARELAGALRVFANPQGNALIPLHNDDYPYEEHLEDVLRRQSRRSGMLLNSDELVNFVHLPSSAVRTPALQRDSGRTKAAPTLVRHGAGIIIGDNEHNGVSVPIYLNPTQRVRHTHIIGSNGTGKSSLLFNLIRQDIENGEGIGLLDPHGDLTEQILTIIPPERLSDVVLVDLSDEEFPIGFNLLQAHSEIEKRLLASDLVGVFRRLSTSWGDQMDTVLQNSILAFLKSTRGGTLADLRRFLRDEKFRSDFMHTVQDAEVLDFWQSEFPRLGAGKSVSSILVRLQEFFSQEPLRNMVSQPVNKLDFADIMDSGKIFLAKLSTGLGGEENSYLLGTLLISKFQQLAMARQAQKQESRRDFWLYIDEFQHFISPSMEKILTGARKYRLGFTLAHQNLHQLQVDGKVASAVMTQPCTRIVLRVGDDDAKKLGEGFESFDAKSLSRLEKFHAIVRVEQNDFDFNLALRKPELDRISDPQTIIDASRAKYATPRAEVEAASLAIIRGGATKRASPVSPAPIIQSHLSDKPSSPVVSTPTVPNQPQAADIPYRPPAQNASATPAPITSKEITAENAPQPSESMASKASAPSIAEVPKPVLSESAAPESGDEKSLKIDITREAEALDFTVDKEHSIPNLGRTDLVLTRGSLSIACEISHTTPPNIEADHIRLRLKAGFQRVAVISANRRKLNHIESAFTDLNGGKSSDKVGFYVPKEFFAQLFDWAAQDPEGGAHERSRPKKRQFGSGSHENTIHRPEEEAKMLAELKQIMDRNRKS